LDNSYFISPDRWWRVEAELPPGTAMKFRFTVDGREGVATAFDRGLMQDAGGTAIVEDSLVVLHRTSPAAAWMPVPATIAFLGSHTDKFARIDMTGVESGDYAIGWRMHPTSIIRQGAEHSGWRFFPDPASEQITVVAPPTFARETATLLVHDLSGRLLDSLLLRSPTTPYNISGINAQTVILSVRFPNHKEISLGRLHIVH
jgi:hypothetical protein